MTDRSNESTDTSGSYSRRLSMDEYSGLYRQDQPHKQGFLSKGMSYLFKRSKSDVYKEEGMINRSVPCYWHEQK
jgi:hypothetical protein